MKETINNYNTFKHWYQRILEEFKFDPNEDKRARNILLDIIQRKGNKWNAKEILTDFIQRVNEKSAILIYGCGPTLDESVEGLIEIGGKDIFKRCINLAADGASVLLRKKQLPIDGIFTDLDGITPKEFSYGEYIIIHAHGDNIEKLKAFKQDIIGKEKVIATTQVKPKNGIFNPGGFTDGDRILYFIKNFLLPTQKLYLIGMDFNDVVGKYSKPQRNKDFPAPLIKRKKLKMAVSLLQEIVAKVENEIYFVNSAPALEIFQSISIFKFIKDHLPKV